MGGAVSYCTNYGASGKLVTDAGSNAFRNVDDAEYEGSTSLDTKEMLEGNTRRMQKELGITQRRIKEEFSEYSKQYPSLTENERRRRFAATPQGALLMHMKRQQTQMLNQFTTALVTVNRAEFMRSMADAHADMTAFMNNLTRDLGRQMQRHTKPETVENVAAKFAELNENLEAINNTVSQGVGTADVLESDLNDFFEELDIESASATINAVNAAPSPPQKEPVVVRDPFATTTLSPKQGVAGAFKVGEKTPVGV